MALAFAVSVHGDWTDTSPGIDLGALPSFPLSPVELDGLTKQGASAYLRGTGTAGVPWEVHGCSSCFAQAWRADLDGNGTLDYAFFGGGPLVNGSRTPLYSNTILLMDDAGLPVPFLAYVYHETDGIERLVDLDRDGRAELLVSLYDDVPSDTLVGYGCSGHWVTQLYRFRNLRAEEVRGTIGGIAFPFVKEWSYRDTKCDVVDGEQTPASPPEIDDRGTATGIPGTTRIRGQSGGWLQIDPLDECTSVDAVIIVYDQPARRRVSIPSLMTSHAVELVEEIQRDQANVRLSGINRYFDDRGSCRANLLWATLP